MHEFDARRTMPEGITTVERTEMPPRAEFRGIRLESAAAGCAGHGGELAAAYGHQVLKRVWLLKHGGPPGADRGCRFTSLGNRRADRDGDGGSNGLRPGIDAHGERLGRLIDRNAVPTQAMKSY